MITSGHSDQSASVRCKKHAHRAGGMFFRTEPMEGAPADYLCLFCWIEAGEPFKLTRAEFESLKYAPMETK
jgi:hypothetical protein